MNNRLQLSTVEEIKTRIEPLGFTWTGKWGWGSPRTGRFEGPTIHQLLDFGRAPGQSSLYIRDNYLSATGHYRNLEKLVPPSSHDNYASKAPEWKERDLVKVLEKLEELLGANELSDD